MTNCEVTLDSDNIAVYAGEKHGIDLGVSVTTQSGKDGATVSYPFTVTNTGNIADNYNFLVCLLVFNWFHYSSSHCVVDKALETSTSLSLLVL